MTSRSARQDGGEHERPGQGRYAADHADRPSRSLSERLIDRDALLRKEMRTVLVEVDAVFETNAELAGNRNHRLVAEAHARRQGRRVALREIRPLVTVEA